MLGARVKIASYECKSTVGCGSNLMDVFVYADMIICRLRDTPKILFEG